MQPTLPNDPDSTLVSINSSVPMVPSIPPQLPINSSLSSIVSINPLSVPDAQAKATLAPVMLPDDLPDLREQNRQALLAKLHARTDQLSSTRKRKVKTAPKIEEAARTAGLSAQASSAQAILGSMRAEDVANLVQSTLRSGVIPPSLQSVIPPEARNLNKKDLTKLIRQLQKQ